MWTLDQFEKISNSYNSRRFLVIIREMVYLLYYYLPFPWVLPAAVGTARTADADESAIEASRCASDTESCDARLRTSSAP